MIRFFGVPVFLSIIVTIFLSQVLWFVLAVPVANLSASFVVAAAMICFLVLQRHGVGPKLTLLKQQYLLYAVLFGPMLLFVFMLLTLIDQWLGVSPGRQSLIGLVAFFVVMLALRFLVPRAFFSAEERMEINAQGKALTTIEKLWKARTPLSFVPGARALRRWSDRRL